MSDNSTNILLQAMMGGQMQNDQAQSLLEQYIAQRGAEDPRIGMLINMMAQKKAATEAQTDGPLPAPPIDLEETYRSVDINHQVFQEKKQKLKEKVAFIYLELREMRRRNQIFAAAVGACPDCWGTDPSCEICQGAGRPGVYPIDHSLFADLVAPAVEQYRKEQQERKTRSIRATPDQNTEKD